MSLGDVSVVGGVRYMERREMRPHRTIAAGQTKAPVACKQYAAAADSGKLRRPASCRP